VLSLCDPVSGKLSDGSDEDAIWADRQFQEGLVNTHLGLAAALARRFANRGEPTEDLIQVANLALVKAARRFDRARDLRFSTYATACILGELKRYFRDSAWLLRVPRAVKEMHLLVTAAQEEVGHQLRASPTSGQIAGHLGVSDGKALEAIDAGNGYRAISLDAQRTDSHAAIDVAVTDPGFDRMLDRAQLQAVLSRLDEREETVLRLLYFDRCSQTRAGAAIGMSQTQISRLAAGAMAKLRVWLDDTESTVPAA